MAEIRDYEPSGLLITARGVARVGRGRPWG
jgi:hypothetical protein